MPVVKQVDGFKLISENSCTLQNLGSGEIRVKADVSRPDDKEHSFVLFSGQIFNAHLKTGQKLYILNEHQLDAEYAVMSWE